MRPCESRLIGTTQCSLSRTMNTEVCTIMFLHHKTVRSTCFILISQVFLIQMEGMHLTSTSTDWESVYLQLQYHLGLIHAPSFTNQVLGKCHLFSDTEHNHYDHTSV